MTDFPGVVPAIATALTERGFVELTAVQRAVVDAGLAGADALVSARTGSGKTVAFGLALAPDLLAGAERFDRASSPLALAVAPTRELALQVARELEWLYARTGATIATCVGGMDMRTERRALERGAHIVVGTPGRLRDHITRGSLDLVTLKAVVLDEADEMLDLGFRDDLEFILQEAPAERRTLMFSATVPRAIADLARTYQTNAVRIEASSGETQHADIDYQALMVHASDRENAIINVLRFHDSPSALVFCSTRAAVNHLMARFSNRGFPVVALSGELSQTERTHALQAMRDGRARVCIATDVAARGIDLPNLDLVIHADLPTNPETLLHRSGRTGRAGRKGVSVLIVAGNARRKAERILTMAKVRAEWTNPPSADEIRRRDDERLLAHAVFAEQPSEDEAELVAALMARHGAEAIASGFIRLVRAGRSAPEELSDMPVEALGADKKPARSDFTDGRWFTISAGRKHRAEPRWLIPLLCKIGHFTRKDIGAIKMRDEDTLIELSPSGADSIISKLGPSGATERGLFMLPLPGKPDLDALDRERKQFAGQRYERPEGVPRYDKPRRTDREWSDTPPPKKPRPARDDAARAEDAKVWADAPVRKAPGADHPAKTWPKKNWSAADNAAPVSDTSAPARPYKARTEQTTGEAPRGDWQKPARSKGDWVKGDAAPSGKPKHEGAKARPWADKPGKAGKDGASKGWVDRPKGEARTRDDVVPAAFADRPADTGFKKPAKPGKPAFKAGKPDFKAGKPKGAKPKQSNARNRSE